MGASPLHYHPWRGRLRSVHASIWPIARTALEMMRRRRLFWVLYGLSLTIFFMFFFGQYLLAWAESQTSERQISIGFIRTDPARLIGLLRDFLRLNGTAETYRSFFRLQGSMVIVILALAGSILVGNDFRFGSLPFYLSKPPGRWHYLLGKCLAVGLIINLLTTFPALLLFIQFGLLNSWDYFVRGGIHLAQFPWGDTSLVLQGPNPLLLGILGYGLVLTVCLSLFVVATATWARQTVPLIMIWTSLFLFLGLLATALVDGLQQDPRWRLFDLWNDTYLVGSACFGLGAESFRSPRQPSVTEAALVLGSVCVLCLIYLNNRIRGVEVIR